MAFGVLVRLAHVEDLDRALIEALFELLERQACGPLRRAILLPPGRHAAVQEAAEIAHSDRLGKLECAVTVIVVAAGEDDLLIGIGEPGEAGGEARLEDRDVGRAGDVGVVELQRRSRVDEKGPVGDAAFELARRLASYDRPALRAVKRAVKSAPDQTLEVGLALERRLAMAVAASR